MLGGKPFETVLIANRGEIACRIARTCQRLGIRTVAVYSDADADARHVVIADEAVRIGGSAAADSYLRAERILEAAAATGAQAIHPGFGFLAENADFARAVGEAGLAFVGPPPEAIAAMGDKIESKKLAAAAEVSTVPGHIGVIEDEAEALAIAGDIGLPVMIKASAGGGGKGMRVAWSDEEVKEGFRLARNEARSSFGDDRVFIEKFIENPRHVEIQVLADAHGNTLYLGERECSIQRRNQKVIEEAPSPAMTAETRRAMGEEACALARAVGYRSAGTVENILGPDGRFYFLEMNTRLQVEHPVTELITGLDLVEWMLRIAAGERLPLTQDEVTLDGWAIESRVYAEDPERNFMPSIGRLKHYQEPAGLPDDTGVLRIDSGVVEGSEISMFYDPMIAKVVTHAATREQAVDAMAAALEGFVIEGIDHNIAFLEAIMDHPRFREGRLSTNFIAEEFPEGFASVPPEGRALVELAAAAAVAALITERPGERNSEDAGAIERVVRGRGGLEIPLSIHAEAHAWRVTAGSETLEVATDWRPGRALFSGVLDDRPFAMGIVRRGPRWTVRRRGAELTGLVLRPRAAELARRMPEKEPPDTSKLLLSPMPGLLVSLAVEVGQAVKAGEELAVVEAMKMENILRAERDGTVEEIFAEPGASLAVDQPILGFE